jgi:DNA excision repair protein ERCC-4
MREEWEKYLLGKAELHGLHKKKKKRQSQQPKGFGVLDGEFPAGPTENAGPVSMRNLETDALLAAASGISNLTKEADAKDDSVASGSRSGSIKGKGKGVSRKIVTKRKPSNRKTKNTTENENCQDTDVEASDKTDEQSEIDVSKVSAKDVSDPSSTAHIAEDLIDAKMLPPVQFYALDSDQHVLDIWKPSAIIVYHPDITFVREIEVYKAENPSTKLRVFFLFYEESSEVQKFESSIRRENEAFESLIRQKSLMMIPVDQVVFQLNFSPLLKLYVP